MPPAEAEARALQLLESSPELPVSLEHALTALPAPWGAELAAGYLKLLATRLGGTDVDWRWAATLAPAARALPPAAFPRALQLAESCDTTRLPHGWGRALEAFQSTLRMRQRLLEEIRP
jgi:hypothetical protein